MRLHSTTVFCFAITLASTAKPLLAASPVGGERMPPRSNSLQQILERSCGLDDCAPGYRVHFKQATFEPNHQQATFHINLEPNAGIDYPILTDTFEGELLQNSFAAICKIRHVDSMEMIMKDEVINPAFEEKLKLCFAALTEKTELALGHSN
ncbi:MAG: hypothetical protein H7249_00845 [Chitinophagaceae bacterium]|nr:hypothetical protein [Oligoflexus sp.]